MCAHFSMLTLQAPAGVPSVIGIPLRRKEDTKELLAAFGPTSSEDRDDGNILLFYNPPLNKENMIIRLKQALVYATHVSTYVFAQRREEPFTWHRYEISLYGDWLEQEVLEIAFWTHGRMNATGEWMEQQLVPTTLALADNWASPLARGWLETALKRADSSRRRAFELSWPHPESGRIGLPSMDIALLVSATIKRMLDGAKHEMLVSKADVGLTVVLSPTPPEDVMRRIVDALIGACPAGELIVNVGLRKLEGGWVPLALRINTFGVLTLQERMEYALCNMHEGLRSVDWVKRILRDTVLCEPGTLTTAAGHALLWSCQVQWRGLAWPYATALRDVPEKSKAPAGEDKDLEHAIAASLVDKAAGVPLPPSEYDRPFVLDYLPPWYGQIDFRLTANQNLFILTGN